MANQKPEAIIVPTFDYAMALVERNERPDRLSALRKAFFDVSRGFGVRVEGGSREDGKVTRGA